MPRRERSSFSIDARPFQEDLRQAEAAIARDQAQLRQAEATLARDTAQARNADADANRYAELAKPGSSPKRSTTSSNFRGRVRAKESAPRKLQSKARRPRSKVTLPRVTVRSWISAMPDPCPRFPGRTGNLLVHPGNLVKANDVALVVINQVSPIFVSFSVPEQHLGAIRQRSARQKLVVHVTPHDAPDRSITGYLSVVDNTVDTSTGGIRLKAMFDNRNGLFGRGSSSMSC